MTKFKYAEVKEHLSEIKSSVKNILQQIEEELIDARDSSIESEKIPVYLTKWRVKDAASIYLKTKRKMYKYDELEEISDYGGLRILCLFEQDIIKIHAFIIKKLLTKKSLNLVLKEFQTFNWEDDQQKKLNDIVVDSVISFKSDDTKVATNNKDSGYSLFTTL